MNESSLSRDRDAVARLYERHALAYDQDRSCALQERAWLDRFLVDVRRGGIVLDVGCGTGEPIAGYLASLGFRIVGLDTSPAMIELCRARLPDAEFILADMRQMTLGRRFDGILAWDSFFHLGMDDQRAMFSRFASHARVGAPLMFTSGSEQGESLGSYCGEPLYHASLSPVEYRDLLVRNGYSVRAYMADDPECGHHTVWLATYHG